MTSAPVTSEEVEAEIESRYFDDNLVVAQSLAILSGATASGHGSSSVCCSWSVWAASHSSAGMDHAEGEDGLAGILPVRSRRWRGRRAAVDRRRVR